MNKSLNLSGIILSLIGNLLVCFSSIFNFFIPAAFPEFSHIFIPLYTLMAIILVINLASLTLSTLLLLSINGLYKKLAKNTFGFILVGLNLLTIIFYAIFMLLYPWSAIVLNGFIIFVLLTTASIFLIVCHLTKQKPATTQNVTAENAKKKQTSNSQIVKAKSEEEKLQEKLAILSSMKNMDVVSEEEFSKIKEKLVYDYLNKNDLN